MRPPYTPRHTAAGCAARRPRTKVRARSQRKCAILSPVTLDPGRRHPRWIGRLVSNDLIATQTARLRALSRPVQKSIVDRFDWRTGWHESRHEFFDFIQSSLQHRQMQLRIVEDAEVRRRDPRKLLVAQLVQTGAPLFQVKLGRRHRNAQVRRTRQANAADIASKADVLEKVGEVMVRMTRRIDRPETQSFDFNVLPVAQHHETIFRHWQELAPERIHPVAVNPPRALEQLLRID